MCGVILTVESFGSQLVGGGGGNQMSSCCTINGRVVKASFPVWVGVDGAPTSGSREKVESDLNLEPY